MSKQTSIVTTKGQVTIPAAVRKRLGLKRGDEVAFVVENDKVMLQPVEKDIAAIFGIVKATRSVSLQEMDEAVRRRAVR